MSKRSLVFIAAAWLVILVAALASAITMRVSGAGVGFAVGNGVYVTEEEYERISRYARLEEVRRTVKDSYYREVDDDTLVLGAVRGMLESLEDRYTFYYTVEEMEKSNSRNTGVYKGIGVTIAADKDGNLSILRIFRDTPAERAGMQTGDLLIAVNGQPVSGATAKDVDDAVAMIADCGDELFTLTLLRGSEELELSMRRETVTMNRVYWEMMDDIGYVQITDFLGDDVEGFLGALASIEEANARGMIIDLRNNTGGYLDDVVEIADALLPEGLIVYTEDRAGSRREERSDAACVDFPVVCLVNDMSASASEVLSGAVQDYGIGAIIGETTFGKGIVQTILTFQDGAGMQLTTATYYTPSGRCIHGTGIEPDYTVPDDPETAEDETLLFALDWLRDRP